MITRGSKGAGRLSCLVMNPDNVGASMRRREKLLAAFRALPDDDQADLLEAVESIVARPGWDSDRDDARTVISAVYAANGWETRR